MNFLDAEYELTHTLAVPEIAPLPAIRSERAATVARWFGIADQILHPESANNDAHAGANHLGANCTPHGDRAVLRTLLPQANQITLLTGPSGAGKSSMLRALQSFRPRAQWMDLGDIALPDVPLVDCFEGAALDRTLALLSSVGLAEAWSYLRTPSELSEGQRWRLKLALAIQAAAGGSGNSKSQISNLGSEISDFKSNIPNAKSKVPAPRLILLSDEFAALLDRVTAAIVARCLRRVVSFTPRLCAIVATSHEDLMRALMPDMIVNCDYRWIEIRKKAPPRSDGLPVRVTKSKRKKVRKRFSRKDVPATCSTGF